MRVLVVDDDEELATQLGRAIRGLGHEAVLAFHPIDAIQVLDGRIDAVIADLEMPAMDGVQFAKLVRRLRPELPIAFCTESSASDDMMVAAETLGPVLPRMETPDDVAFVLEGFAHAQDRTRTAQWRRARRHDDFGDAAETTPG